MFFELQYILTAFSVAFRWDLREMEYELQGITFKGSALWTNPDESVLILSSCMSIVASGV
jgi:hypothetical protein